MLSGILKYFDPYISELKKVEWPSWEELYVNTITVLVASLLLAILIALMDLFFQFSVGGLYELVG